MITTTPTSTHIYSSFPDASTAEGSLTGSKPLQIVQPARSRRERGVGAKEPGAPPEKHPDPEHLSVQATVYERQKI
jgi:hypothetical protein